jgi:hypothetical protein
MISSFCNSDEPFMFIDENTLETIPGSIYIETSYQEVYDKLGKIEQGLKSGFISFCELINHFYELIRRVPIPLIEIDFDFVIRCRPNYEENGVKFSNASQLSYNPNRSQICKGRFNVEKEPVFYGTLPTKSVKGDCGLTAILEANKNILSDKNQPYGKYVTLSKWNIKSKFLAINLSMLKNAEAQNFSINEPNKLMVEQVSRKFTKSSCESFLILSKYMAKKAATTNDGYIVTNALKQAIKKFYNKNVNAIIYPSFTSEFNGLNIAIDQILVNEGFIEFDGAFVYKISSHPYEFKRQLFPCSNYARPDRYGNFRLDINNCS